MHDEAHFVLCRFRCSSPNSFVLFCFVFFFSFPAVFYTTPPNSSTGIYFTKKKVTKHSDAKHTAFKKKKKTQLLSAHLSSKAEGAEAHFSFHFPPFFGNMALQWEA